MPLMHRVKSALVGRVMAKMPLERLLPRVEAGPGAARQVGARARELGIARALVVTDEVLLKIGVVEPVLAALREEGIEVAIFSGVQPDPAIEQVLLGAKIFQANDCDGIVAVGGGSSIDCAKIVGAYVRDPRPIGELAGAAKLRKRIPPLIAVATTHGTGSETTYAAVITAPAEQRKFSIADPKIMPKVAVLDPELVVGLPKAISAATGMDALTHAVEAYLSPWSTPSARARAESAVVEVMASILTSYERGDDLGAREAMLRASFNAGAAINIGGVGYVHAIAHAIGGQFHTPHGDANAMLLPLVLEFYGPAAYPQLAVLARRCAIGGPADSEAKLARAFIQRVKDLHAAMAMPTHIPDMRPEHIAQLAHRAMEEAHGERHSMLFNFTEFFKDPGYPTIKYMSTGDCQALLRRLLPPRARL